MAAQSSASSAPPSDGGKETSRLHIRGIKEMPAGHDEELATIFREMRRAADVSLEKMAGRLETSVETLDALESGAIFALPPWPELSRIVTAYAALLGLDSRPLLRRLEAQLLPDAGLAEVSPPKKVTPAPEVLEQAPAASEQAPAASEPAPAVPPAARPSGPPMPPSAASPIAEPVAPPPEPKATAQASSDAQTAGEKVQPQHRMESAASMAPEAEAPQKRSSGFLKAAINWLVLIGFVAALGTGVWYAAQRPRMVWSALDTLPDPIPRAVRSAWKFMRPLEGKVASPQITDPDNRKSDKLP
ncbi:MAG: helix-turn-helix domain-containing protein [Alphaproteobacteria bacterium]